VRASSQLSERGGGRHEESLPKLLTRGSSASGLASANPRNDTGQDQGRAAGRSTDIAKAAKVVHMDDKGNIPVLREASNGFTCF